MMVGCLRSLRMAGTARSANSCKSTSFAVRSAPLFTSSKQTFLGSNGHIPKLANAAARWEGQKAWSAAFLMQSIKSSTVKLHPRPTHFPDRLQT